MQKQFQQHDAKAISAAPGIGKKTAEKLIIELKDKLSIEDILTHAAEPDVNGSAGNTNEIQSEAIQALVALGYSSSESLKAVKKVDLTDANVEDVLKEALKHMMF